MKRAIFFIVTIFLVVSLNSCSLYKSQGYVITRNNDTLQGKINNLYTDSPKFIRINHEKIPISDIASISLYSKKNDTTKYEPIDSINLWQVVEKEKGVGIYYRSWTSDFDITDIGYELILKSVNRPPIPMLNPDTDFIVRPWDFGTVKIKTTSFIRRQEVPALLAFINFRYKQHLSFNNFMDNNNRVIVQSMFNYILHKENERLQKQRTFSG